MLLYKHNKFLVFETSTRRMPLETLLSVTISSHCSAEIFYTIVFYEAALLKINVIVICIFLNCKVMFVKHLIKLAYHYLLSFSRYILISLKEGTLRWIFPC